MISTDPKMLLSVSKIFRYDGHKRGGGTKSSRGRQKLMYKVKKEQKVSHDKINQKRIYRTVTVSLNERSSVSLSQLCCRVSTRSCLNLVVGYTTVPCLSVALHAKALVSNQHNIMHLWPE